MTKFCCNRLVWSCFAAVALTGCGKEGPQRYELSGTVTYNDQPVPAGQVTMVPDSSQNNHGPGGFGMIENGQYRTYIDRGAVGGPHRITIAGYNATPGTVPESQLKELFFPYETVVDLPRESGVVNFDIPPR